MSDNASTDQYGRSLFDATCSECGQACKVPFEPKADRPVYCRNCFQKHKKPRRDFGGGSGGRGGYGGGRGGYGDDSGN